MKYGTFRYDTIEGENGLYLSATEGKTFAHENSNGSFLARQDANKKITKDTLTGVSFAK